jgi:hypothetical protein
MRRALTRAEAWGLGLGVGVRLPGVFPYLMVTWKHHDRLRVNRRWDLECFGISVVESS